VLAVLVFEHTESRIFLNATVFVVNGELIPKGQYDQAGQKVEQYHKSWTTLKLTQLETSVRFAQTFLLIHL
jgi:hypothetical protein